MKPVDDLRAQLAERDAIITTLNQHDVVVQLHYRELEVQNFNLTHEVERLTEENLELNSELSAAFSWMDPFND